jgi:glycosyltransferase involved in cell wall biosynthesis
MIDISVIIPTYKPGSFLGECLASLDSQTLSHSQFEVLLILNGPREPYMSQIEDFLKEHPSLLCRLIYSEKNGVSLARNIGLDEAQGRYICFIDDDDLVTPDYLASLLAVATPDTIALPYICAFEDGSTAMRPIYISEDFVEGGKDIPYVAVRRYFYISWGKLIPCEIIGSRRFDVALRNGEDSQFMLLISDRIRRVNFTGGQVRYMYRQRSGSAFYGNKSVWYHFTNMLVRLYKATKVYLSAPCRYSFPFYAKYMLATFMGGIRQMLHKGQ